VAVVSSGLGVDLASGDLGGFVLVIPLMILVFGSFSLLSLFHPTSNAPDRRSSHSSMMRTMSVNDHNLVVTPVAIAGVTRKL